MQTEMILPMGSADDLGVWERLDDVIMGGQSDSALKAAENGGELRSVLPLMSSHTQVRVIECPHAR